MTYTIKTNSSLHVIASMFDDMGRKDNFSLEGIEAIMDYLEETSEDGTIDLDVIAICCDFNEAPISEVLSEFDLNPDDYLDLNGADYWDSEEEFDAVYMGELLKDVNSKTWAVALDNGNILYIYY